MTMQSNNIRFTRAVETELSLRKSLARKIYKEKRNMLERKYPDILSIEREINDIAIDIANKIVNMPSESETLCRLAEGLIDSKRNQLNNKLIEYGLPVDYLDEQYVCATCRDTGIINGNMCSCIRQLAVNSLFDGSGLNPSENFDSYREDLITDERQRRAALRIRDYCYEYAVQFPNCDKRDLLLIGAPGVGKTYLLNCIGGKLLSTGYSVLKLTASRLIQTVIDGFKSSLSERPDFLLPELLIIDDLGAEPMIKNVTVETLLSVICERQDANRATLFATNCKTNALEDMYGSRIVSRMLAPRTAKVILIDSVNLRMLNK